MKALRRAENELEYWNWVSGIFFGAWNFHDFH
jgi:hypothetical protein